MTPGLISFLFAAGFSTWVYSKVSERTGGNNRDSLIVAAIAFAFGFFILLFILSMVDNAVG